MPNTLEIRKLGESGETLREISCISGRITVFRSLTDTELDEYKQALWGNTKGKFSILFNGQSPKQIERIDSEPFRLLEPGKVVGDVFSKLYLPEGLSIESFLTKVGLGGVIDIPCGKLTPLHQRIVRLIQAVQKQEAVIILDEPFDGMSPAIYEQIAKYLITLAPVLNLTIVVTKLSQRPECWIESPFVSRVQLQRPRKGTVGFGTGEVDELIKKIRTEEIKTGTLITHSLTNTPKQRAPLVVGVLSLSIALGVISALVIKSIKRPEEKVAIEQLKTSKAPEYIEYPPEVKEAVAVTLKGQLKMIGESNPKRPETKIEILKSELLKP
jgi:hypothetical protein